MLLNFWFNDNNITYNFYMQGLICTQLFMLLQDILYVPGGDGSCGSGPCMGQGHTSCQLMSSMLLVIVMYFNMHLPLYVYIYSHLR